MMRWVIEGSALAAVLAIAASPHAASAQEVAVGPMTWAIRARHIDVHPRSSRAARATLDRLGTAAMNVCGASAFSLREVQASTRASPCWRDAMADVLGRIGDPVLDAAYQNGSTRHRGTTGALR